MLDRKSHVFVLYLLTGVLALGVAILHSRLIKAANVRLLEEKAALVEVLGMTDLCLFTDARYSRNPSLADLSTAFQDHPLSLEHFPSGSLFQPRHPPVSIGPR